MNITEHSVARFYESINISTPSQLSIISISERLGLCVQYWTHTSAMAESDGVYKIFINDSLNEQQQWQDFGHEMRHYFNEDEHRCNLGRIFIDYCESKADYFMYHFCVPTFMLMKLKEITVYKIMRLFNVELDFALRRLEMYQSKLIDRRGSCVL